MGWPFMKMDKPKKESQNKAHSTKWTTSYPGVLSFLRTATVKSTFPVRKVFHQLGSKPELLRTTIFFHLDYLHICFHKNNLTIWQVWRIFWTFASNTQEKESSLNYLTSRRSFENFTQEKNFFNNVLGFLNSLGITKYDHKV